MEPSFEAFVTGQLPRIMGLSRLLTGNRADAEDLAQEAFSRAQRKWHRVSAADDPGAYLRRLLVNLHHSRGREQRPPTVAIDAVAHTSWATVDPSASVEDVDALRRSLAGLPLRQRTVVVLRYYEDLDTDEIAAAMSLSESSVRSALSRALATLRAADHEAPTTGLQPKGAPLA